MILRKCECGGNGKLNDNSDGDLSFVFCDKCGFECLAWAGRLRAMKNWNAYHRKRLKEKRVERIKTCNNCNHHYGEECTDPDLSEVTHQEYYNGCKHWRPRDAA